MSKSGTKIPRPIALTFYASMPNEVVHFDYLYTGPRSSSHLYIFVLKDDLSFYVWLTPCNAAVSETSSTELSRWLRTFPIMHDWVSDHGLNFKNRFMEPLASEHRTIHDFEVAYSPWVNDTVENANRHVRASCTAILTELKLASHDWSSYISLTISTLNKAPSRRLDMESKGSLRTPLEVMTGI